MKEIYIACVPTTTPTASVVIDEATTKTPPKNNKTWPSSCKPLPPPPLTLVNPRVAVPDLVVDKESPSNNDKITYMVESSARNMNLVKLNRSENVANNLPAKKVSTSFTVDLPKVSREASPHSSPTLSSKRQATNEVVLGTASTAKTKKPRKKWLPSLGPPEGESLRILAKASSTGAWYCDNAELFSAMSALTKQ